MSLGWAQAAADLGLYHRSSQEVPNPIHLVTSFRPHKSTTIATQMKHPRVGSVGTRGLNSKQDEEGVHVERWPEIASWHLRRQRKVSVWYMHVCVH